MVVEGLVCENPQVMPEKTELMVCVLRILEGPQSLQVTGKILLTVREPYPFRYGDAVRFYSRLRVIHNFGNPGGLDYEKYLRLRGVLVRASVNDPAEIIVLRREMGNPLRIGMERFRDRVRKKILETAPETEGLIIQAMILGIRSKFRKRSWRYLTELEPPTSLPSQVSILES